MFQNVWNAIDGREPGWGIKDYDLFYFDDSDLSWEAENEVLHRADRLFADVPAIIEMRNEARVHLWYEEKFGVPAPPFSSARDAIAAFASTSCAVGISRAPGALKIYAPYGLEDMITMHLRPNRRLGRVS